MIVHMLHYYGLRRYAQLGAKDLLTAFLSPFVRERIA